MAPSMVKNGDRNKFTRRLRKVENMVANEGLDLVWTGSLEIEPETNLATGNALYRFMLLNPNTRRIILGGGEPGSLYSASLEQIEVFLTTPDEGLSLREDGCVMNKPDADYDAVWKAAERAALALA
jgi:hypothetical protein